MLCELCHKNEAAATLHRKDEDGDDEELYVCKDCLARHRGATRTGTDGGTDNGADRGTAKGAAKSGPKIVTPDGEEPPAFIRNFLDAAVGLIEGVAKSETPKERKCPVCGRTWNQIKETRAVGCADCWAQFGKEIRHEFLGGSYGPRHIGKIPEKTPDGKPSRAFLEKELRDAVTRQNYRKAAKIRKLLDELNGETK